ncbi:hypothetical protein CDL15_Pgr024482 [Punica granatum]|uniref:DNA polymerase alpha subunit B n=1 Tax=Punica granatum TaxID=22663 RepID=A0A218XXQ1_PUNGR|nr:hypothetical protein CDL15_Pgr024482 [Punica granatum]
MEEEIKAEFRKSGFALDGDEDEILRKCLTFCINYSLTPSDLVSSWEVYYLNRLLNGSTVQNAEMDGFLLHLQNVVKESIITEEPDLHIYSSKDVDMILNNEDEYVREETIGTPSNKLYSLSSEQFDYEHQPNGSAYSSGKPSNVITPFGQRREKFAVKYSINQLSTEENGKKELVAEDSEDDFLKKVKTRERCSMVVHGTKPEPNCRFMYDRTEDRFRALESRIRRHTSAFVASGVHKDLMDPTVASQKSIFAVGMICCDGEGHLNDKSILLQSSAECSGGQRVRLDLQRLSQFSIFPGQVVGIEGNNPSGHCLIASKIIDSIPVSVPADVSLRPVKRQALNQGTQLTDPSSSDEELSVIIAAGPFTTTDNLFFEPLTELLAYASRKTPQLLILLGPFVDSEHPEIRRGATDRSFDEIFHVEIMRKLRDYVDYLGDAARVVLVPSIRDANHDFVFPQPGFDIPSSNLNNQITNLTNPGIFEANQVKVGCCTVDILKQLSGEEMSRNPSNGIPSDRMSRLAYHILSQRSFYPLYPPAEDVPLDFSLAPDTLHFSLIPDILVLPSDMKYFVKVVSGGGRNDGEEQVKCICINPGRLAKGECAGTFVELHYNGDPDTASASIIGI